MKTDASNVLADIKGEAKKIDSFITADLERISAEADGLLVEVLKYGLLNGGKRIRPLLVVLASRLCGRDDDDCYRLGCAFEYLHAATLFHDDIIDNSDTRRGVPSVFKKFGVSPAILAGDYLHALAMSLVGQYSGRRGLEIFCRATTGMVDGEFMQFRNAERVDISEENYYLTIMGKTGLLIAAACEVGAVFGNGTDDQISSLRNYGVHLGCAFQIIDDLLDYAGDPVLTGKAVGNDLAEGKKTLPLILAMQRAIPEDLNQLQAILADEKQRSVQFSQVYQLINNYNGFSEARKKAELSIAKALEAIELFSNAPAHFEAALLHGLAQYVLVRKK